MKTAIERIGGEYVAVFTQGNQTFSVHSGSKDDAKWTQRMLDIAFKNYNRERNEEIKQVIDKMVKKCKREAKKITAHVYAEGYVDGEINALAKLNSKI